MSVLQNRSPGRSVVDANFGRSAGRIEESNLAVQGVFRGIDQHDFAIPSRPVGPFGNHHRLVVNLINIRDRCRRNKKFLILVYSGTESTYGNRQRRREIQRTNRWIIEQQRIVKNETRKMAVRRDRQRSRTWWTLLALSVK